ncbi:MAG: hypothetical protein AAFP76_16490 [Bacteroidota bacterium]
MEKNVDVTDLKKIIRDLMLFITVEGKQFVDKDQMEEYVLRYVNCFVNSLNLTSEEGSEKGMIDIMRTVAQDLKGFGKVSGV